MLHPAYGSELVKTDRYEIEFLNLRFGSSVKPLIERREKSHPQFSTAGDPGWLKSTNLVEPGHRWWANPGGFKIVE
jgi:hypothetical protein